MSTENNFMPWPKIARLSRNCLISEKIDGSRAVPGFMNPEGIVVFHEASQTCFKKTIDGDDNPKSA